MWVCGSEGEEERESRLGIHVYTYILPNHVLGDLVLCIQLLQVFLLSLLVWRTNRSLNKLGHRVASEIHPPLSLPLSFPISLFPPGLARRYASTRLLTMWFLLILSTLFRHWREEKEGKGEGRGRGERKKKSEREGETNNRSRQSETSCLLRQLSNTQSTTHNRGYRAL